MGIINKYALLSSISIVFGMTFPTIQALNNMSARIISCTLMFGLLFIYIIGDDE